MANASLARGFIPVRHRNGALYNGAYNTYFVPASYGTALYIGDPVAIVTNSADAVTGIQTVQIATAAGGAYSVGIFMGIANEGDPVTAITRDMSVYHPASTAQFINVIDDPDMLFEVQENGNMGVGAVGRNVDMISGTGSTVTGYSGWQISSTSLNTTATLQMRVVAPIRRADNDPTLTNAKWLVAFNLHSMRNTTGV